MIEPFPLSHYVDLLRRGSHFALARYGDGEFYAILGIDGENCDGHIYFKDLGNDLKATLEKRHKRPFYYGLVRIATQALGKRINQYTSTGLWCDGTVLVDASRNGKLKPFADILRKKRVCYIGPEYLKQFILHDWLDNFHLPNFITIPSYNCYLMHDYLLGRCAEHISRWNPEVLCFSAGMTSNVLIHRLWLMFPEKVTLIDIGSLFDGYAGKMTRKYMHNIDWASEKHRIT